MSNTAEIINFPHRTEQPGGRMADLSNGYTKVANEIQQLKPRLRMSGREWQCFEAVIWLTYGWNKKQDRVTNTVIPPVRRSLAAPVAPRGPTPAELLKAKYERMKAEGRA